MLGAIIGDIVGSRYEFNPTNDYFFPLFGSGCDYTDDTICTIAVADAILRGRDYGSSIHEWCRKYPDPKGDYGGRFFNWVMSDDPKPYFSFGNGSAMRVSPVAWWFSLNDGLIHQARLTAECTHNHPKGIEGAIAVATAIFGCRKLRAKKCGRPISRDEILEALSPAIGLYSPNPLNWSLNLEKYRNHFDVTCQGTVPVALWIVLNSSSFEDAIRKAVSLGADADTLGAVVGSIAEGLWGIPEWMKLKALSYLPADMRRVVHEFNSRLKKLRKLSARCQYYHVPDFRVLDDNFRAPYSIERQWAHDLAVSFSNADAMNAEMARLCDKVYWAEWAEEYDLPLSLIGYIFRQTADPGMFMGERVEPFISFLRKFYFMRKSLSHNIC